MALIIDKTVYDNEKVLFFFHNDIEDVGLVIKQRTVSLSWGDLLLLNTLPDIKTKLENIRLKMVFLEGQQGQKITQTRVINNINYNI